MVVRTCNVCGKEVCLGDGSSELRMKFLDYDPNNEDFNARESTKSDPIYLCQECELELLKKLKVSSPLSFKKIYHAEEL